MHTPLPAAIALALVLVLSACHPHSPAHHDEATATETAPAEREPEPVLEVVELPDGERQIQAAVIAAPPDLREGATVKGYDADGQLVALRAGTNGITCLADRPGDERFSIACYHDSLERYMARGRELRAEGVEDTLAVRHEEIDAGVLEMPSEAVTVYTLGGDLDLYDAEAGSVDEERAMRVYAIYVKGATVASTGLPTTPQAPGAPWIMRPGTPSAHVMVVHAPPAPEEDA